VHSGSRQTKASGKTATQADSYCTGHHLKLFREHNGHSWCVLHIYSLMPINTFSCLHGPMRLASKLEGLSGWLLHRSQPVIHLASSKITRHKNRAARGLGRYRTPLTVREFEDRLDPRTKSDQIGNYDSSSVTLSLRCVVGPIVQESGLRPGSSSVVRCPGCVRCPI
jgi:hypothetical protein